MEENNQQQNIPLCRKNCGFFGSPNFDGLCSKCHRSAQAQQNECITPSIESRLSDIHKPESSATSTLKRECHSLCSDKNYQLPSTEAPSEGIAVAPINSSASMPDLPPRDELSVDAEVDDAGITDITDRVKSDSERSSPASAKTPRCNVCRKRVGPAGGYSCRCGGVFCSLHRYSDGHNCSYDYRKAGQEDIRRSNPQVVCSKLHKI
ncbi:unnamed protein product [Dicrocoelium dendriticum]|nr:unnamed protein product [Dicrocoelium dendriticum]